MTTATNDPAHPTAGQALGAYGERVAATHLREQGMVVLDRNWRCAQGEIDLVLRDGDTLVVCEVKTRTGSTGGTPHEAVTPTKLERLVRLGESWQVEHGLRAPNLRVDLVAVHHPPRGAAQVEHVRGLV
ncbi:YraN family protein [Nocardioides sp. GY 10127]|uniref:YraN family protein n=1 Tax=Nocardioides sp. GY 10127 TaxID=2569762 RepID=UPI0010A92FC6|nr:YraN family protein [Nocardioides sp. GY 10127]TIC80852.1 YraN family protein [Nocardioides sp. GY 10127]